MRVAGKGMIDRNTVRFRFDGIRYRGFAGDTVASALLANDVADGPVVQVPSSTRCVDGRQ